MAQDFLPKLLPETTRLLCGLVVRSVRWEYTRLYKLVFSCTPTLEEKLLWEDHHDLRLTGVNISAEDWL